MKEKIVIYQMLPRLFGNRNQTNKRYGTIEENGCGKFEDIDEKALKAIKKMGFTHVWYTGVIEHATKTDYSKIKIKRDHRAVVKGQAGSPYAIKDYYDVDPDLAVKPKDRMKEYEALIKRTHEAGLKVIMDFVPNHVARQYNSDAKPKGVKDLGEDDLKDVSYNRDNNFYYMPGTEFAPQFDLYGGEKEKYEEKPAKATGNDCFSNSPSINDWFETVKLNYGIDYSNGKRDFFPTPDTWNKMRDILTFWTEKDVDGFRCDMAEMVPVEFWEWVIPQIKEIKDSIIFVAETYNPSQYSLYINRGHFDYLYDKVGLYDTLKAVVRNEQPTSNLTMCWQRNQGIEDHMLNFLENHDEQRIASDFFAGDAAKGIPAAIVSATLSKGPFMVYFGQELGESGMDEEGYSGRDGRTTIFDYWSVGSIRNWVTSKFGTQHLTDQQKELQKTYSKLLNICKKEKAIAEGKFYDLMYCNYDNDSFNSMRQFCFMRGEGKEVLLIVANFDDKTENITVNIPQNAFEYFSIKNESTVKGTELLSGETDEFELEEDTPLSLTVPGQGGVIWKLKI